MTDSIIGYNFESNHATPTDDSNQIWLNWGPVVCRREDFLTVYIGGSDDKTQRDGKSSSDPLCKME